ncbi:hypothetical protein [Pseudoalteromonas sp. MMG024]|uniref:hypothetical protein n=1 Tax=Pseudoalteromonas sp. MMG024 TaxID=2909980 RepID=UPI001F2F0E82|nr:hypothetical protein [Pseudoalteromonas sp. MMG024]MCF6459095.1 hypothetical protein [Pseudoalteromonas sp. MMG024]
MAISRRIQITEQEAMTAFEFLKNVNESADEPSPVIYSLLVKLANGFGRPEMLSNIAVPGKDF